MVKIAMWSGPRNLSTAMMYAFAARGDCAVWDEPFYAPYLAHGGPEHPLNDEILAAHEADPDRVAAACAGPIPEGQPHFYMKQMPHHMLPAFPLDWAKGCVSVHLIRHPARVIASYGAKRGTITLADLGYPQHQAIRQRLPGPVIDSADIRADPKGMLEKLCVEIGIPFTDRMLSWPAGPRPYDGIWAKHWYGAVHASTGFAGAEGPLPDVSPDHARVLHEALPIYEAMQAAAISA